MLASERGATAAYAQLAEADNTRGAWCARYELNPLPAFGPNVAAFLAGERGRQLAPETLKLRRAAIRYLHRATGCPVPTDDACVSETLAGITRDAAKRGQVPRKKVAATATMLCRLLVPIGDDPRGRRDRALLLVASPAPCGARSWRRSGASTCSGPSAASGSPCR